MDKPKNKSAARLGRMARGHKKTLTEAERARRSEWCRVMTQKREANRAQAKHNALQTGGHATGLTAEAAPAQKPAPEPIPT
jgi:hypothetical protein